MCKVTVTHFTMEFVLLVSAHQFRLFLISLVICSSFETSKQGVITIEESMKCILSHMKIVYTIEFDGLLCFGMWVLPKVSYIVYN